MILRFSKIYLFDNIDFENCDITERENEIDYTNIKMTKSDEQLRLLLKKYV